jgi:hypothetical protein
MRCSVLRSLVQASQVAAINIELKDRQMITIDTNKLFHVVGGKGTGSAGGLVHSRGALPVGAAVPPSQRSGLSLSDAYRQYGFHG